MRVWLHYSEHMAPLACSNDLNLGYTVIILFIYLFYLLFYLFIILFIYYIIYFIYLFQSTVVILSYRLASVLVTPRTS